MKLQSKSAIVIGGGAGIERGIALLPATTWMLIVSEWESYIGVLRRIQTTHKAKG